MSYRITHRSLTQISKIPSIQNIREWLVCYRQLNFTNEYSSTFMTPQVHNKTLCLVYSFLSAIFILLLLASPFIINNNVGDSHSISFEKLLTIIVICSIILVITLLLLSTAYGLFKRRRWVRVPALVLVMIFVWSFPLGTMLAIYTWWFLHSEGATEIYSTPKNSTATINQSSING